VIASDDHGKPPCRLLVHRARSRIGGIEIEGLLAVALSEGHAVIMPIGAAPVFFDELLYRLLDGIKAVDHEAIAQRAPTLVLATLYTDIDEYERLGQKPPRSPLTW
jgi:hypothetical protein